MEKRIRSHYHGEPKGRARRGMCVSSVERGLRGHHAAIKQRSAGKKKKYRQSPFTSQASSCLQPNEQGLTGWPGNQAVGHFYNNCFLIGWLSDAAGLTGSSWGPCVFSGFSCSYPKTGIRGIDCHYVQMSVWVPVCFALGWNGIPSWVCSHLTKPAAGN